MMRNLTFYLYFAYFSLLNAIYTYKNRMLAITVKRLEQRAWTMPEKKKKKKKQPSSGNIENEIINVSYTEFQEKNDRPIKLIKNCSIMPKNECHFGKHLSPSAF